MSAIEEDKGLPRELGEDFGLSYRWLLTRIAEVDRIFIERGFLSVQAEIDRGEDLCGEGSYSLFVNQQSHPEKIDEWRNIEDDIHRELVSAYESQGKPIPEDYFARILGHAGLSCFGKEKILQRHFPDKYFELKARYLLILREARLAQQQRLCTLWGSKPPVRLHQKEAISLRKEVMNSVMADAFGSLGFVKRNRHLGVDVFHKPLTQRYAVVVAPDTRSLQDLTRDYGEEYDDWTGGLSLNWLIYLGSADKFNNMNWYYFTPVFVSHASNQTRRYNDTHSLEVTIRAEALLYELLTAPFEEIIRKHG